MNNKQDSSTGRQLLFWERLKCPDFVMIHKDSQPNSEPSSQSHTPPPVLPTLSDDDVQLLVEFLQLLDEWDRGPTPLPGH